MNLVEIRDLDGPNMFALFPVIKLEVTVAPGEALGPEGHMRICNLLETDVPREVVPALVSAISVLHGRAGLHAPNITTHDLDLPGHVAVCFRWEHRPSALAIARTALDLVAGDAPVSIDNSLATVQQQEPAEDDLPTWVRDGERRIPIAAITGTNGKTTTTRLLTHITRVAGRRTGWSSSTGVYINGELVIEGDYTGHGGARRVLTDPEVDCGILESARGGILLRGLAFESNDVGVFLNVSPDHLYLHGITRLETLAWAKSSVVRVTRPGGVAVLNADDPLVLAQREHIRAESVLISRNADNPEVIRHLREGGRAVINDNSVINLVAGKQRTAILPLTEVPLTYQGAASHMVENTLAAVAAAIGLGVDHEHIRHALQSFYPDTEFNAGRLNVFEINGRIVIIDYAHNESGLTYLFDFVEALNPEMPLVTAVVGTAGDRSDEVFANLGRIAGQRADRVLLKENPRFLRGRSSGESFQFLRHGVEDAEASNKLVGAFDREYDATVVALDTSEPGETILVMCIEDYADILEELERRGARPHAPVQPAGGD